MSKKKAPTPVKPVEKVAAKNSRSPRPFVARNLNRVDDAIRAIDHALAEVSKVDAPWSTEAVGAAVNARTRLMETRDHLKLAPADFALPRGDAQLAPGDEVKIVEAAHPSYLPLVGDDASKLTGSVIEIRENGALLELDDGVRVFVTARSHLRRLPAIPIASER